MIEHVERLRTKPAHVRRTIAYGFSVGVTALVAVGWFGALAATGAFSLKTHTAAGDQVAAAQNANLHEALSSTKTNFSELLGAVGVATSTSSPASLTIVETASSSTLDNRQVVEQEQTVIPF